MHREHACMQRKHACNPVLLPPSMEALCLLTSFSRSLPSLASRRRSMLAISSCIAAICAGTCGRTCCVARLMLVSLVLRCSCSLAPCSLACLMFACMHSCKHACGSMLMSLMYRLEATISGGGQRIRRRRFALAHGRLRKLNCHYRHLSVDVYVCAQSSGMIDPTTEISTGTCKT